MFGNDLEVFYDTPQVDAAASVEEEVAAFFRQHPYILVSEERLAVLLCRPLGLVAQAVRRMEEAGSLARKHEDTILYVEGGVAGA